LEQKNKHQFYLVKVKHQIQFTDIMKKFIQNLEKGEKQKLVLLLQKCTNGWVHLTSQLTIIDGYDAEKIIHACINDLTSFYLVLNSVHSKPGNPYRFSSD